MASKISHFFIALLDLAQQATKKKSGHEKNLIYAIERAKIIFDSNSFDLIEPVIESLESQLDRLNKSKNTELKSIGETTVKALRAFLSSKPGRLQIVIDNFNERRRIQLGVETVTILQELSLLPKDKAITKELITEALKKFQEPEDKK